MKNHNRSSVRAKKSFGQHFLKSEEIARVIARCVHASYVPALMPDGTLDRLAACSLRRDASDFPAENAAPTNVLEIGPGMGVLSRCLWEDPSLNVKMVEVDAESVIYLTREYPDHTCNGQLLPADFLKMDLKELFDGQNFVLTGNFPYNISTQIIFRVLENRDRIPLAEGMFQKEVGERVCAAPGSKAYGILSVLLQAFYDTEYLFTVEACEFNPPPQVRSCVIRLTRNKTKQLECDERLFTALVKKAFNQRRKTLRNALKNIEQEQNCMLVDPPAEYMDKRAEQLSVNDYIRLTACLQPLSK